MEILHLDIRSEHSTSIALYDNDSFCQEVGAGAWAFRIPAMNLEDAGNSVGGTATRFEFLGVLHGLDSLAAADTSGCPVHVFSDWESTVSLRSSKSIKTGISRTSGNTKLWSIGRSNAAAPSCDGGPGSPGDALFRVAVGISIARYLRRPTRLQSSAAASDAAVPEAVHHDLPRNRVA
jgi:hypothetical protein